VALLERVRGIHQHRPAPLRLGEDPLVHQDDGGSAEPSHSPRLVYGPEGRDHDPRGPARLRGVGGRLCPEGHPRRENARRKARRD
jgi:hypothetical protein